MSDDKSKRGVADRSKVSLSEEYEVKYWSERFGVTPEQLRTAVQRVGNSAVDVEKALKNKDD